MEDRGGYSIDEKWGDLKNIRPVMEWNIWPSQKSEAGLDKVAVLSLCGVILDTSVWTRQAMSNTVRRRVRFKFDELAATISLECFNGMPKKFFHIDFNSRKMDKTSLLLIKG